MADWIWCDSPKVKRYRDLDTGRFVSSAQVRTWVSQSITTSEAVADELAHALATDKLNVGDWETLFRTEIKDVYIQQYLLGRGGLSKMTQEDWGSIGGLLGGEKGQFRFLSSFAREIAAGKLTEKQIAMRSRMYINSARDAYARAQLRVAREADWTNMRWVTDPLAEHCEDCLAFEALGWQRIADKPYGGATPASGATACLSNCRCHLELRP